MKIVVTGAAGFIGSSLIDSLIRSDPRIEIVGIDKFTDYYDRELKEANLGAAIGTRNFTFVEADLLDPAASEPVSTADVVIHLAGQPGVRKSWGEDFSVYLRENIAVTQHLLEISKSNQRLRRFVYASSSSVYGDAVAYPTSEEDIPAPVSPYGVSKLAAEHLAVLYAKAYGVPTVSLRFFTVYGPRQRPDMAFTRFLDSIHNDRPLTVFGSGEQVREFTYIDDIVSAVSRAALMEDLPGGLVMNLSGGSSVSLNEVIDTLRSVVSKPVQLIHMDAVKGDVFRTGGKSDRARNYLHWKPEVALAEGLSFQARWFSKGRMS